jgi:predicted ATPase/class 3 adenylate cyclase/Tfp pilus assembly protein PilF
VDVDLPSGTLTFGLTDIESSTRLWEEQPSAMEVAVPRHLELIATAVERHGGFLVRERGEGDSTFSVFTDATSALQAALDAQCALHAEPWPTEVGLRVRFALHTGEARYADGEYSAPEINRCARIRSLASGGQTLISERTWDLVREALPPGSTLKDLGTHRLRDLSRPERIAQLCHVELPDTFPALRSLDMVPHNLPIELTSFIGREAELNRLRKLVQTSRMVTITGAGGLGKTRLALQLGAELIESYADGVWFADLAPVTDGRLVAGAACAALSLRDEPGRTALETLSSHLAGKQTLMIVDNCEHVVADAVELTGAILRGCPDVSIVATSRSTLNVTGAATWSLPPMQLPAGGEPAEDLASYEAVRLFCERAALRNPDFALSHDNARHVLEICRRLEGIPLAVELAAAHANVLSPAEIARRLEDRFGLLTGGPDDDPRHSALHSTLDWSYGLLDSAERLLLGRLAVFVGGFSLEAVESVCSGGGLGSEKVLDVLRGLVDSSLVLPVEAHDETRFGMLETVREYAMEQRAASHDDHPTEARHLAWVSEVAEWARRRGSADEAIVLNKLEREYDNIRAALSRSVEIDPEGGAKLAAAVHPFWYARGYWAEMRRILDRHQQLVTVGSKAWAAVTKAIAVFAEAQGDLEKAEDQVDRALEAWRRLDAPRELADCLLVRATVSNQLGDRSSVQAALEEARTIAERIGDDAILKNVLNNLAVDAARSGDYVRATETFERIVSKVRATGSLTELGRPLFNLGMCRLSLGDTAGAEAALDEVRAISFELGNRELEAAALAALGGVAEDRLEFGRAHELYERSATIQRELDDRIGLAHSLGRLADVSRHRGDLEAAVALIDESIVLWSGIGHPDGTAAALVTLGAIDRAVGRGREAANALAEALRIGAVNDRKRVVAVALEGLAGVLRDRSEPEVAATLFGASLAIREEIGVPVTPADREAYERDLAETREALGVSFATALERGRGLSVPEILEIALDDQNTIL